MQLLERSSSTFSGNIQRVCEILEACTKKSLLLLDEIGGGTDPSEGAALVMAVLGSLASSVQVTLATTHSAKLHRLKTKIHNLRMLQLSLTSKHCDQLTVCFGALRGNQMLLILQHLLGLT